ncbi:MAG: hypothetical protein IT258_24090 [Saprospiraceae bacterium]|nr:hypothetical protein [Saprospiraceae bacterium]
MSASRIPTQEEIADQIRQQLETDERMKKWFSQYRNWEVDGFIKNWANYRRSVLVSPNNFGNDFKAENKEFNQQAREALEYIQQKKLFNLQCEWRAGKLDLPFIKITYDFEIFGRGHVMECPFLPPVTMQEVELYCQFLNSPDADDLEEEYPFNWQDYNEFKDEDEDGEFSYLPPWYDFYDGKVGTGYLLRLPDVKGEREEYYRDVFHKHKNPNQAEYVRNPELDKPSLFEYEARLEFAKKFEPDETLRPIISYIKFLESYDDSMSLDADFDYLKEIPEPISFVPHADWKESLRLTVVRYRNQKTAAALPRIWRQYHKNIGDDHEAYVMRQIAKANPDLDKMDDYKLRGQLMESVLSGRELLGEPRDFDF